MDHSQEYTETVLPVTFRTFGFHCLPAYISRSRHVALSRHVQSTRSHFTNREIDVQIEHLAPRYRARPEKGVHCCQQQSSSISPAGANQKPNRYWSRKNYHTYQVECMFGFCFIRAWCVHELYYQCFTLRGLGFRV